MGGEAHTTGMWVKLQLGWEEAAQPAADQPAAAGIQQQEAAAAAAAHV